jgi:hypothetical protein
MEQVKIAELRILIRVEKCQDKGFPKGAKVNEKTTGRRPDEWLLYNTHC